MKLRELRTGELFAFVEAPRSFYVYRGNGWYGSPAGYDGGPWHDAGMREVASADHEVSNQWQDHLARQGNE